MHRRSDSARGFLNGTGTLARTLQASCKQAAGKLATMSLSDTGAASVVTLAVNAAVVAADAAEDTAADETLHELETLRNLPAFCSTSRWYLQEWVDLMTEDGHLCQMLEDLVYLFMSRDPLNRAWVEQNQLNWAPQTHNYAVMLLQRLSKEDKWVMQALLNAYKPKSMSKPVKDWALQLGMERGKPLSLIHI